MGIFDVFFGKKQDPAKEAGKYLNQVRPMLEEYYDPYVEYGQSALPTLEEQYRSLLSDPGAFYRSLGEDFYTSPGYQFQMDEAMNAANQAAGASGLLGTPAHQQQSARYAQNLANQEYNNYISNLMDLYSQGLAGTQGQAQLGLGATGQLASGVANTLGSQANLGFSQAASQNEQRSQAIGDLIGTAAAAFGGGWG